MKSVNYVQKLSTSKALFKKDIDLLADMCADLILLSEKCEKASKELEKAKKITDWDKWSAILDISSADMPEAENMSATTRMWE